VVGVVRRIAQRFDRRQNVHIDFKMAPFPGTVFRNAREHRLQKYGDGF
jgi:hypothetical protein